MSQTGEEMSSGASWEIIDGVRAAGTAGGEPAGDEESACSRFTDN